MYFMLSTYKINRKYCNRYAINALLCDRLSFYYDKQKNKLMSRRY